MTMLRARALLVAAGAAMVMASAASAQFETEFEAPTYTGSADGTVLTGQDGWYLPSGIDQHVYTYTDNVLGLPANPNGGDQFIGGTSQGGTSFARGERLVSFEAGSVWETSYDMAANFLAAPPSAANLASFSLQPSATCKSLIQLNNFIDLNDPFAGWKAEYNIYDAAGSAIVNQSPGAAWAALKVGHWYRLSTKFDLSTNAITEVSVTDLETGEKTSAEPAGWYLQGGNDPSKFPNPTGVRFFVGGQAGNTAGFDNLDVAAGGPPPCPPDLNADGALDLFDFLGFVNLFNRRPHRRLERGRRVRPLRLPRLRELVQRRLLIATAESRTDYGPRGDHSPRGFLSRATFPRCLGPGDIEYDGLTLDRRHR